MGRARISWLEEQKVEMKLREELGMIAESARSP